MISSEKHPSCGLILPLLVSYHAQYLCSTSLQHVAEHSLGVIFSASVYILQCCSFLQNSILYMIACLVTWKFVLFNLFRPNSSPSLHPMTMMVATLQRWRQQCQQIWRSATRGKPSNTSLKRPQPWTPGWSRKTASHHRHGSAWLLQWQNIWYIFFWLLILDANVTIITQVFFIKLIRNGRWKSYLFLMYYISDYLLQQLRPSPANVKVEPGDQPPHKAPRPEMSIFDDDDDDVEITAIETVTVEAMAQAEVQRYRRLPKLPMGQDPLLWWQQHELELPGLTKLALKYAVVQATSVPAESL